MLFEPRVSDAEVLSTMLGMLEREEARDEDVAAWLDARFGKTSAIAVIDMCGFSRTAESHGILEFLRRLYEVQRVIVPIIHQEAGTVLNTLADSLACLFPSVEAALLAAGRMMRALDKHNARFPSAPHHYLSIGIGFGRILVFDNRDAFGPEMNRAGKLGEDMAGQREILLTPAAVEVVSDDVPLTARAVEIGGVTIGAGLVDLSTWDPEPLRGLRTPSFPAQVER